jgi:ferredoxin-NADP reductase
VMVAGFDEFLHRTHSALRKIGVQMTALIEESFGPMP